MGCSLDQLVSDLISTSLAVRKETVPQEKYADSRLVGVANFVDAGFLDSFAGRKQAIRLVKPEVISVLHLCQKAP